MIPHKCSSIGKSIEKKQLKICPLECSRGRKCFSVYQLGMESLNWQSNHVPISFKKKTESVSLENFIRNNQDKNNLRLEILDYKPNACQK